MPPTLQSLAWSMKKHLQNMKDKQTNQRKKRYYKKIADARGLRGFQHYFPRVFRVCSWFFFFLFSKFPLSSEVSSYVHILFNLGPHVGAVFLT